MSREEQLFREAVWEEAGNQAMLGKRASLSAAYLKDIESLVSKLPHLDILKDRAGFIRRKSLEGLEKNLIEWETNFRRNGGKVIWAQDAAEALKEISRILNRYAVRKTVRSSGRLFDEIQLGKRLSAEGISCQEMQYQPAQHRGFSTDQAYLEHWAKELGIDPSQPRSELSNAVIDQLRNTVKGADAGIFQPNFLLADQGSVAFMSEDNLAQAVITLPKVLIGVCGIDAMLPHQEDMALFAPLYSTYRYGRSMPDYLRIMTGPKKTKSYEGPEEMYMVLIDNGRTDLLGVLPQRDILSCIDCGACHAVCPVYRIAGESAYMSVHTGPVGAVMNPYMLSFESFIHQSYASTLCGACSDVCPVGIDIHKLLLHNRQQKIIDNRRSRLEETGWFLWKRAALRRSLMNGRSLIFRNMLSQLFFGKSWSREREMPQFAKRTFNEEWKKQRP